MAHQGEDSEDFLPPIKRKRIEKTSPSQKCIICQDIHSENLRKGKAIETFVSAVKRRKDEVYSRLSGEIDDLSKRDVYWHSSCYSSYTSEQNIRYATAAHHHTDEEVSGGKGKEVQSRTSRSSVNPTDWSKCLFCRNKTHKKVAAMYNVCTFEASERIRKAAEVKGDEQMLHCLRSVNNDLIAAEAKYHKDCLSSYVSKSNLKHQGFDDGMSLHEAAFKELAQSIGHCILYEGRAYDMSSLLLKYQDILKERGVDGASYTKHRLKERLKRYFGCDIEFFQQANKCKSEIVYPSALSIHDLINEAAATKMQTTASNSANHESADYQQIRYVAGRIREEIRKCNGIKLRPLDVKEICLETAKRIVPPILYMLIRQIICPSEMKETEISTACKRIEDERKVLTISQDIIHSASNARVKLPKQIGLAMAVHHLTGSKVLITLLNRMGHCSSYSEVQEVDTSLAMEVTAMAEQFGTVVPSNISPGPFIQIAADNNDLKEETLDGKNTTHATTMVVYQRKQFGPELPPTARADHTLRRRSLEAANTLYEIRECCMHGRRPLLTEYKGTIQTEWFTSKSDELSNATDRDNIWALLRIDPSRMLDTTVVAGATRQLVPSWSGFNALLFPDIPRVTNVGYCPLLDASSTEFSTVYTVMKNAQQISSSVGQLESVITFDLAIYVKAKQIQLKFPDEFSDTILRLGGFHVALNFLSIIGKKYQGSGLDDLLIESGVYAAGTTSALLAGRSYNRGVRAHKLCFEAFFRQLWNAFLTWCSRREQAEGRLADVEDSVKTRLAECREQIGSKNSARTIEKFGSLQEELKDVMKWFKKFKEEQCASSKLFAYWEEYNGMVNLLLHFLQAERTGDWKLHLSAVAAMTPYFFAMDRHNYARWLPVYLADMHQIESKHPRVYVEFMRGNHVVCRSSHPFSQVSTDMALEQSINADSKTKGGIVGISMRPTALQRWFLTCHERAAITSSLKSMYAVVTENRVGVSHKESSKSRVLRDEGDVQKLLNCFTSNAMTDPFSSEAGGDLFNFATGVLLPTNVADNLLSSTEKGQEQMDTFVNQRLETSEVNFWDPVPNLKVKSFSTMAKKTNVKAKDRVITVSADQDLFGRLLIAANTREINLKEVLSYELSAVPFALAHQDGSIRKTTKSVLAKMLEEQVEVLPRLSPALELETAHILDGMAIVQMMKSAGASTFGELASKYYTAITAPLAQSSCKEVHMVFDQYWSTSIKSGERSRRGSSNSLEVYIHGPSTPIPKQWAKYITNPQNKINLCDFLTKIMCSHGKEQLVDGKKLVIGGGYKDGKIAVSITNGASEFTEPLECSHEEADTRLLLHAKHASSSRSRVIIQSPDTDVLVLCATHFDSIGCEELWFKTGIRDHLRYVPVHRLSVKLGQKLCRCLPAFHALTGCDTTSALAGVSKKKAWERLSRNKVHQDNLGLVGQSAALDDLSRATCEAFICDLYPAVKKQTSSADELRYVMFCQKRHKSELLPPTSDSVLQHARRVSYQAFIWRNALVAKPHIPSPEGNGWEKINGILQPCYMTKAAAPSSLLELTTCKCKKSGCQSNCSCVNLGLSCTEACFCMANMDLCKNPHGAFLDASDESEDDSDSETD